MLIHSNCKFNNMYLFCTPYLQYVNYNAFGINKTFTFKSFAMLEITSVSTRSHAATKRSVSSAQASSKIETPTEVTRHSSRYNVRSWKQLLAMAVSESSVNLVHRLSDNSVSVLAAGPEHRFFMPASVIGSPSRYNICSLEDARHLIPASVTLTHCNEAKN